MSELKMIVEQAITELGGWDRPDIDRLLDLWQELSGVDVRKIDENTPFDPGVVDKLLATFPQVLEEAKKAEAASGAQEPEPERVMAEIADMAEDLTEALAIEETGEPKEEAPEVELAAGVDEVPQPAREELAEAAEVLEAMEAEEAREETPEVDLSFVAGLPGIKFAALVEAGKVIGTYGQGDPAAVARWVASTVEAFRGLGVKGEPDEVVSSVGSSVLAAVRVGGKYLVAVMGGHRLGTAMAFLRSAAKKLA